MLVFAVETSCDETSVCVMDNDKNIYSHIIFSQEIHKRYGGVVPELASRAHLEILQKITKEAFEESGKKISDIDIFSATCGPGLIGPLLIGLGLPIEIAPLRSSTSEILNLASIAAYSADIIDYKK